MTETETDEIRSMLKQMRREFDAHFDALFAQMDAMEQELSLMIASRRNRKMQDGIG